MKGFRQAPPFRRRSSGGGIRMLLNESITIERDNQHIYLAGIDDAHFYGDGVMIS